MACPQCGRKPPGDTFCCPKCHEKYMKGQRPKWELRGTAVEGKVNPIPLCAITVGHCPSLPSMTDVCTFDDEQLGGSLANAVRYYEDG